MPPKRTRSQARKDEAAAAAASSGAAQSVPKRRRTEQASQTDGQTLPTPVKISAPKDDAAMAVDQTEEQEVTPQEVTPQEVTPQEVTPQEVTPQEVTPQRDPVRPFTLHDVLPTFGPMGTEAERGRSRLGSMDVVSGWWQLRLAGL
jgi:hypothetical protein